MRVASSGRDSGTGLRRVQRRRILECWIGRSWPRMRRVCTRALLRVADVVRGRGGLVVGTETADHRYGRGTELRAGSTSRSRSRYMSRNSTSTERSWSSGMRVLWTVVLRLSLLEVVQHSAPRSQPPTSREDGDRRLGESRRDAR